MILEKVLSKIKTDNDLKILDLCGAPGGKSTNILSYLNGEGILFANETIRSRAEILKENIFKWGFDNVIITNCDPLKYGHLEGYFDIIVVDAPCSGEGLFRKDPAAAEEWSEKNLQLCCERQQRIVHDVWPALKEGGHLIYSTCTYNPEENEENIRRFLQDFSCKSIDLKLENFPEISRANTEEVYGYYAYPHRNQGEGFFVSVIQKKSPSLEWRPKRKNFRQNAINAPNQVTAFFKNPDNLFLLKDQFYSLTKSIHEDILFLPEDLNILSAGIPFATVKKRNVVPDPAGAMALNLNYKSFTTDEVSFTEALQFLKKEPLYLNKEDGWILVKYDNTGLGWIKKINQFRANNNYPKEWRIRKELPTDISSYENHLPLKQN